MRILRMFALSLLAVGVWVALANPAVAQTVRTLYRFAGGMDGSNPYGGLIADAEGNLYGTTAYGGSSNCESGLGCGTVFKLDKTGKGKETVLYSFTGGTDGANPYAGLIRDADGNLYGTTAFGGSSNAGTVFRLDATGKETVLYSFSGVDGENPYASLIRDAAGNLYGTTFRGGESGLGTVFKLDGAGNETVLHSFNGADGQNPYADLTRDAEGNLYGTTNYGGDSNLGTVFKLDRAGNETVLHSFNLADGAEPTAPLIRDAEGNLYGTTGAGGESNWGTVFKLDKTGNETVLHSFSFADGGFPFGGRLIRDVAGNLYGTTSEGGAAYNGTVFRLDRAGNVTVLYSFTGGRDGGILAAGLIRERREAIFYSTTFGGGVPGGFGGYGNGTIFKIKVRITSRLK